MTQIKNSPKILHELTNGYDHNRNLKKDIDNQYEW